MRGILVTCDICGKIISQRNSIKNCIEILYVITNEKQGYLQICLDCLGKDFLKRLDTFILKRERNNGKIKLKILKELVIEC